MSAIPSLPVTKAVVTLLASGTGKPCGHGRLPTLADGSAVTPPYTILYPTSRGVLIGSPLGDQSDWTELVYQVTSVGGTRLDQAEWMDDKARTVLTQQTAAGAYVFPFTVPGLKIVQRRLTEFVGPDEAPGGIVSLVSRYAITVTGA